MATQSPIDLSADRGPRMILILWLEGGIAAIVFALRIWGRLIIRKVWADDYTMGLTLVLFVVQASLATYLCSIGGSKHLAALSPTEANEVLKFNWITQVWGIFAFGVGKSAVALLILRIIDNRYRWHRYLLYGIIASSLLVNTFDVIITFAQCNPPKALWNPQLLAEGKAKCWSTVIQHRLNLFVAVWNILADFVLAVLPVTIFYKLQLGIKKKIGLCVLLSLGSIAGICGSIKSKYLSDLNARSDLSWETYNLYVWHVSELFVIIVCGSVPPIKPVYDLVFNHKRPTRAGYTQSNGYINKGSGSGQDSRQWSSKKGTLNSAISSRNEEGFQLEEMNTQLVGTNNKQGIMRSTDFELSYE